MALQTTKFKSLQFSGKFPLRNEKNEGCGIFLLFSVYGKVSVYGFDRENRKGTYWVHDSETWIGALKIMTTKFCFKEPQAGQNDAALKAGRPTLRNATATIWRHFP